MAVHYKQQYCIAEICFAKLEVKPGSDNVIYV